MVSGAPACLPTVSWWRPGALAGLSKSPHTAYPCPPFHRGCSSGERGQFVWRKTADTQPGARAKGIFPLALQRFAESQLTKGRFTHPSANTGKSL